MPISTRHRRPASDYARLGEAAVALTISKLAIKLLPFRFVANSADWRSPVMPGPEPLQEADQLVAAAERVARRLPWHCVCFDKGLAVHWMLRRRRLPSQLHYGIGSNDDRLTAHVWVSLNGQILIGEADARQHALVATFPDELS